MGQLKRRRPQHLLRPDEMLATLASLRLHALLQHGGLWLAVTPETSELLNQCCTGQMDGGPGTAEEVAAVLIPLVGEEQLLQVRGPGTSGSRDGAAGGAGADGAAPVAGAGAATAAAQPAPLTPSGAPQPQAQTTQQQQQAAAGLSGAGDAEADESRAMEVDAGPQQQPAPSTADADPRDGRSREPGKADGGGAAAAAADASGSDTAAGVPDPASTAAGKVDDAVPATAPDGDAAAAPAAVASAAAGGRGSGPWVGRGRGGRRGGLQVAPYSPAAEGCRLVAVRLTLEEAFFLHYVLRCLEVYELQPGSPIPASAEHVRQLDTEGLWSACSAIRSNFVTSYAAYHHLKAKGWIPRSGLLYGVDYVVYQLHPVGAHSDFGVLVVPLGPDGSRGSGGPHEPPLGWLDLQITNRLINQVVKKLVLLYLYERPGPDHTTPRCLDNFAVEERIVRRWVPDATRD